jgi:DNA-binding NtrC family response regulator
MGNKPFSRLNQASFLQTFVSQSVEVSERRGCTKCRTDRTYIEELGLNAGNCFEEAYRQETGDRALLDHERYANLIVELKNKIGGNFSRGSSAPGMVTVVNTVCPFGEAVKYAPELCKMTSSVFGGIAARNFGYAKVVLAKRIAIGDSGCEVHICTDSKLAENIEGDEYHYRQGMIVGAVATTPADSALSNQAAKLWCDSRPHKPEQSQAPDIVGKSKAMLWAMEVIKVVAPTVATVLIAGETGVGKEVIARAIHAISERWNKKFLAVNCGAIPENLVESLLFGHERGAFTGAYEVHHGLFERAEGGTLFLDEIDSLQLAAQARLLRVLQDGEFERVGGKQVLAANVRVIAAAGSAVERKVAEGTFRGDLYYRLNVVPIHLPPLRERREDIGPLVEHILARLSQKYHKTIDALSNRALAKVMGYSWPGNVRELENVLERSFLFAEGPLLDEVHLPVVELAAGGPTGRSAGSTLKDAKRQAAEKVEAEILREALRWSLGNINQVAKSLQLTSRAVHQKLKAQGINPNEYRSRAKLRVVPLGDNKRLA